MRWHLNIRIAGRLVIAIAVPLAIFAVLAGYDLFQTWRVRSEMSKLNQIAQGVTDISTPRASSSARTRCIGGLCRQQRRADAH